MQSAVISPKNQNYYVGGTALIEINLNANQELLSHDKRLVQTDKLIINKFINGQFIKNNLYRFEVILRSAGKFFLEPFVIKTPTGSKQIDIDIIDVLEIPQELGSVGARLISNTTQALVGQKVNLVYEILCDHDHKIINYELSEFSKNIDVLNKTETKNGNKNKIEFQLVFKTQGSYNIPKIVVSTAKNNSISQLLGFGKTFVSNELIIEVVGVNDIFLFIEKPEEINVDINQQVGESEILTLKGSNYFLTWPDVKVLSGKANIYNSEIKNAKDQSVCQLVVQPLADGNLSLNISGKAYDYHSKKIIDLSYQKNLSVNLVGQPKIDSKKPSNIKKQSQINNLSELVVKFIDHAMDWQLWYTLVTVFIIFNIYLIFLSKIISQYLHDCKTKILYKYYTFLFGLAYKKNDLHKCKNMAKKLLNLNITDQDFLNILQNILYNT